MSKIRGRGEGSICKRKDGTWQCQVTVGRDDSGKFVRKTLYGSTREIVRTRMHEILMKVQTKSYIEPSKITLGQWLDTWLNVYMKNALRQTTWNSYEVQVRVNIKPVLGGVKLIDLTTTHLQRLYNFKLETISPRSVRYIHQVINGALEQAIKEKIIESNPATAVRLPRLVKKEMKVLDKTALTKFLLIAKQETTKARERKGTSSYSFYTAYLLEIATGLRRGELLALRWSDIDFVSSMIKICRQLVRVKGAYVFSETKTELSKRKIVVPKAVLNELLAYRTIQQNHISIYAEIYEDNDLIFCTKVGKPIDPKNFVRNFKGILKKCGLDESIRFHDMRHTFAVMSLSEGVDVKTLQENLGHHSPAFTMEVYGHNTSEMKYGAAEKLAGLIDLVMDVEKK